MKEEIENEKIYWLNPNELVIGENSRFRADENLSELMESIKQNGIVQPITARFEDKMIICGNRRLAASVKLRLEKIPVRLIKGIDEKQLLILNLLENMQRKDISSIEIGRQADLLIKDMKFRMSISELATALVVNNHRIVVCLESFRRLPEKYRKNLIQVTSSKNRKEGDLPENIAFTILNFNREFKNISSDEMDKLFEVAKDKKLSISHIRLIGYLVTAGMPFKKALKVLDSYKVMRINLVALKTELAEIYKKENASTQQELITKLINKAYPNLIVNSH